MNTNNLNHIVNLGADILEYGNQLTTPLGVERHAPAVTGIIERLVAKQQTLADRSGIELGVGISRLSEQRLADRNQKRREEIAVRTQMRHEREASEAAFYVPTADDLGTRRHPLPGQTFV